MNVASFLFDALRVAVLLGVALVGGAVIGGRRLGLGEAWSSRRWSRRSWRLLQRAPFPRQTRVRWSIGRSCPSCPRWNRWVSSRFLRPSPRPGRGLQPTAAVRRQSTHRRRG